MGKKIYVGNLPYTVDDKELSKLFSEFGEITESVLIIDKFSGKSKGFGFVTFAEDASAEKAVAEMDGKDVQGREVKVSEARPMRE